MKMSLMDAITPKQKVELDELKRRISNDVPDHLRNDTYLYLRFLRAREFDVNAAENMLRSHLAWRKANNIDNIHFPLEVSDVVIEHFPSTRIGYDKEGYPVRFVDFTNMDIKGILKSVTKNECITSIMSTFEDDVAIMKDQSLKLEKPIEQWIYILNFENYSFAKATHKATIDTLIALFMAYEANYPERLKNGYIINASIYFTLLFSVIKPFLSKSTIRKLRIFGKDGWKEELLKHIDADQLPAFLGGKRTDPDGNPMCKTLVKFGKNVPRECYVVKSKRRLSSQPGVSKLIVPRMSKCNLNLNVNEAGSQIQWEFESEGKDIGFGLLYKNSINDEATKELIPRQRLDSHIFSETGAYQCEWTGTYILVFDNSYSWIHQKEIYYNVSVINPSDIRRNSNTRD